jgi:hypothetical protein
MLCLHGLPASATAVNDAGTIGTAVDSTIPVNPAPGQKRLVRIGWNNVKGLQDGNSPETLGGYDYEYLSYLAQHANWDCQFVYGTFLCPGTKTPDR